MTNSMKAIDQHVWSALNYYGSQLENHFSSDVIGYNGAIHPTFIPHFRDSIETLRDKKPRQTEHQFPNRIVIVLATFGGVAETVEKMVEIIRHHYTEVFFVVPNEAMSAGTIWCMSGDKIFMDYASSLGPIDPQVPSQDGKLVPALGYIDKVNEFIDKSTRQGLSNAELMMLRGLDLANLRRYEQARDLSVSLLKQWLVKYKFKDWVKHRTQNPGAEVTEEEKIKRAEEIAKDLSDNNLWHSHGRMIGIQTLREKLRLEIEDYSHIDALRTNARIYSSLLIDYAVKQELPMLLHNARL